MKRELRDRWVAALRSGKYKQTKGMLHRDRGGYCCLGVLCEVAGVKKIKPEGSNYCWSYEEQNFGLPERFRSDEALMKHEVALQNKNDHGMKFFEIADYIENNIPVED